MKTKDENNLSTFHNQNIFKICMEMNDIKNMLFSFYLFITAIVNREAGGIGLFITLVPKNF